MEAFVVHFVAPFFAFLLASVVGKFVGYHMDQWRRRRSGEVENDIGLAEDAADLLAHRVLMGITDDIHTGRVTLPKLHRLDRFIELQAMSEFSDAEVNASFDACADAIGRLRKFTLGTFDQVGQSDTVAYHTPSEAEGGYEKNDTLLAEMRTLIKEVDSKHRIFLRAVGTRLPEAMIRSRGRRLRKQGRPTTTT